MRKAISVRSTKEAALYFEKVLPFDGLMGSGASKDSLANPLYTDSFPYSDFSLGEKVRNSILPDMPQDSRIVSGLLGIQLIILEFTNKLHGHPSSVSVADLNGVASTLKKDHGFSLDLSIFEGEADKKHIITVTEYAELFVKKYGFAMSPTWGDDQNRTPDNLLDESGFELCVSGLKLVNVEKISWEEIIEFRKDKDSFKALRDLRLFFSENFLGKSANYAADKLMQLVENQERAAKLWKWETGQKSLSVAFSNQSALVSTAAGLLTVVGGGPLSAVAGAAVAFPLGNAILEFSKAVVESKKQNVDRTTRFLTKIKS